MRNLPMGRWNPEQPNPAELSRVDLSHQYLGTDLPLTEAPIIDIIESNVFLLGHPFAPSGLRPVVALIGPHRPCPTEGGHKRGP
jgi:hypothetical protein